jgi:hypothetical protein
MADTVERSFHERELQTCRTENEAKIKAFETKLGDFKNGLVDVLSTLTSHKTDFISDVDNQIIAKLERVEKSMEVNINTYKSFDVFIQNETLSDEDYAKITARKVPVPP